MLASLQSAVARALAHGFSLKAQPGPAWPGALRRCERMALEEAARLEARRAAKEAEVYGGLDFKPQLNPRSLRMAKVRFTSS